MTPTVSDRMATATETTTAAALQATSRDVPIRVAAADDAEPMLALYAASVRAAAISMEAEVPEPVEFRQRITATLARHPWLVAERDGRIAGFASARPHRDRAGWRWCCESAVYVADGEQRRGTGLRLYRALLNLLRLQNYRHVFAAIMLPNPASVRLHERLGFVNRGVYERAGNKFGLWYDVGFWQMTLGELPDEPAEPIAFPRLAAEAVAIALR
jgi:L-amino acid N-acyltransferase YncA